MVGSLQADIARCLGGHEAQRLVVTATRLVSVQHGSFRDRRVGACRGEEIFQLFLLGRSNSGAKPTASMRAIDMDAADMGGVVPPGEKAAAMCHK